MTTQADIWSNSYLPSTAELAAERGLKRYFTGDPCRHGHICSRWVSSRNCYECVRLRCIKQYRDDREAGRARTKRYVEKNKLVYSPRKNKRDSEIRRMASEGFEPDAGRWRAAFLFQELTANTIREIIDYRPETGEFFWRVSWGKVKPGDRASFPSSRGYSTISLNKRTFYAHRVAWFWMMGEWPDKLVDHIDRDPSNTKWDNLRLATSSENNSNSKLPVTSTSGLKGAYWSQERKTWYSTARIAGRTVSLGTFRTKEEAHAAFMNARKGDVGEFACAG